MSNVPETLPIAWQVPKPKWEEDFQVKVKIQEPEQEIKVEVQVQVSDLFVTEMQDSFYLPLFPGPGPDPSRRRRGRPAGERVRREMLRR